MSFVEFLNTIDLDAIFTTLTDMADWLFDGVSNILTSLTGWINYVNASVSRLVGFATGFGGVFQSVINTLPMVYMDILVLGVTLTIIFVFYKRGM